MLHLCLQIVHRTLAAMLGSLAALAALAFIGDVSFRECNLFFSDKDSFIVSRVGLWDFINVENCSDGLEFY